jgi:hypothetical protein
MFATLRLTKFAGTVLVAGALGLAAVAAAGTAGAVSSANDAFLTDISSEGAEILENTDLTTHQAAVFAVTAVDTYCPKYTCYFE